MTPHGAACAARDAARAGDGPSVAGLSVLVVAPAAAACGGPGPCPSGSAAQAAALAARLRDEGAGVTSVAGLRPMPPALASVPPLGDAWRVRAYLRDLRSAVSWRPGVAVIHVPSWGAALEMAAPALEEMRDAGVRRILRWTGGDADRAFAEHADEAAAIVASADEVVVASPWMADVFRRSFSMAVRVIPNLVDDPTQASPPARRDGPLRLLAARGFTRPEGLDVVVQACVLAAQRGADFQLTIAGDGPGRADVEALASGALGGRAVFCGTLSRERWAEELRAHDVFVNASWIDDSPVSISEALAAGLPVVSTDPGGLPWLVQHGRTGLLSPVGDADALSQSIAALARDRAVVEDLGWRAKVEALRWTWAAVAPSWRAALAGVRA